MMIELLVLACVLSDGDGTRYQCYKRVVYVYPSVAACRRVADVMPPRITVTSGATLGPYECVERRP